MFFKIKILQWTIVLLTLWNIQSSFCVPIDNAAVPELEPSAKELQRLDDEQQSETPEQNTFPQETTCPAAFNPTTPYTIAISLVNTMYCSLSTGTNSASLSERISRAVDVQGLNALASNPVITGLISQLVDAEELLLYANLDHPIATTGFNKTLDAVLVNVRSMLSNKYVRYLYRTAIQTLRDVYAEREQHHHHGNNMQRPPKYPPNQYDSNSHYTSISSESSSSNSNYRPNNKPSKNKPKITNDDNMNLPEDSIEGGSFDPFKFAIDVMDKLGNNLEDALNKSIEDIDEDSQNIEIPEFREDSENIVEN